MKYDHYKYTSSRINIVGWYITPSYLVVSRKQLEIKYPYVPWLRILDKRFPAQSAVLVPELLQNITTTLVYKEWAEQSMSFRNGVPDPVLSGIAEEFQIIRLCKGYALFQSQNTQLLSAY